jgi:hypothetical protein
MKQKLMIALALVANISAIAGNKDRSGQAGGTQLLVNPWAASGGLFGLNGASVRGLESMKINVGGLARMGTFEAAATHNIYNEKAGIFIYNAGLASRLNDKSVFGVQVMSMDWGSIPVTTVDNPAAGSLSNFKPSMFNISLGYAYSFTKSINAGLNLTYIGEGVNNAKAQAVGIDAGIMYSTGDNDELHFGVSLKNVGSNLQFSGDGLTFNGTSPDNPDKQITLSQRSEKFQLPTQLNISTAYDIYLGKDIEVVAAPTATDENATTTVVSTSKKTNSRLTLNGSFISNAFINDYIGIGAEYALKEQFFLRAGYRYESGITDATQTLTFYKGVSVGMGVAAKLGTAEKQNKLQFDYAFKATSLGGVHVFGVKISR